MSAFGANAWRNEKRTGGDRSGCGRTVGEGPPRGAGRGRGGGAFGRREARVAGSRATTPSGTTRRTRRGSRSRRRFFNDRGRMRGTTRARAWEYRRGLARASRVTHRVARSKVPPLFPRLVARARREVRLAVARGDVLRPGVTRRVSHLRRGRRRGGGARRRAGRGHIAGGSGPGAGATARRPVRPESARARLLARDVPRARARCAPARTPPPRRTTMRCRGQAGTQKEKNLRASSRKIRPVGVIARRAFARSLESRTVEPGATRSIGPRDASRVSKTRVARSIAILAKPIPGLGFPVLTDRAARIASAQTDAVAVSNKSSARREH